MWWCGIVMSDMENDAVLSDVVVWCKTQDVVVLMQCGICCGVKYAVMLNVGVVWNSWWCGMVWDVDCGCDMEYVVLWDVVVWNGGAEADCSLTWTQM